MCLVHQFLRGLFDYSLRSWEACLSRLLASRISSSLCPTLPECHSCQQISILSRNVCRCYFKSAFREGTTNFADQSLALSMENISRAYVTPRETKSGPLIGIHAINNTHVCLRCPKYLEGLSFRQDHLMTEEWLWDTWSVGTPLSSCWRPSAQLLSGPRAWGLLQWSPWQQVAWAPLKTGARRFHACSACSGPSSHICSLAGTSRPNARLRAAAACLKLLESCLEAERSWSPCGRSCLEEPKFVLNWIVFTPSSSYQDIHNFLMRFKALSDILRVPQNLANSCTVNCGSFR